MTRPESVKIYCLDARHEVPCPLPCRACEIECNGTVGTLERES